MIPPRLELTGWLTYREPVVFDFSGHWIWAITGENGAGKSAIFDAITYALYGEHRGGAQRDERVVSQGLDLARVVFDFAIGGQAYRIERTLAVRTRSRRTKAGAVPPVEVDKAANAYRLDPRPDGGEAIPVPITGTESIRELEQWVQRTVGFGFSTFTSSVLLRQGEADRLVMAKPADRKKIFLELLDLQRYQQVEALARKRQQHHAHDLAGLERDLRELSAAMERGVAQRVLDGARQERDDLLARRSTRQEEAGIDRALADAPCNQLGAAWSAVCAGLNAGRLATLRERATGLGAATKRKTDLDKQREE